MKGLVFNMLEDFIVNTWDEDVWDTIYETALPELQTQDPFVGPLTYPDEDLMTLAKHACNASGLPPQEALYKFGEFCFPKLTQLTPDFVSGHTHPKPFLMTVESIIHVEVKKMYSKAYLPVFEYEDISPSELILIYRSKRRLYDFLDGMISAVGKHFEVKIELTRTIRENNGNSYGHYHLKFESPWIVE